MNPVLIQVYMNAFAVVLLWTNPAVNTNGTPCTDYGDIEFRLTFPGNPDTLRCRGSKKGLEGRPDSVMFQLPPSSVPRTWSIWTVVYDTLGNASGPGNVITVTKP